MTNVQQRMTSVKSVCITTDCWSSSAQDSFIAVTAHFIDDDFKFEPVLLECCLMQGSHTSVALAEELRRITDKFAVTDKVLIVVSDNAANIKGAVVNELKWKHFGCYAHTINLIVEDALEPVRPLLSKIKGIVSHFKRSNLDTQKLIKYQTDSGVNNPKKTDPGYVYKLEFNVLYGFH